MRQVYTVETNNAFAALAGDASDDEIAPQQKVEAAPAKPAVQPNVPGLSQGPRTTGRPNQAARAQASATGGAPRAPGASRQGPRPPRVGGEEEGEQMRGDRSARAAMPRRAPRPGKDERLDRHSGTGRGREIKKDGGGRHNWGNQPADFGAEVDPAAVAEGAEQPAKAVAKAEGEEAGEPASPAPVKEEEPKVVTMTLADYEAQQESVIAAKEAVRGGEAKVESGYEIYTKVGKDARATAGARAITVAEAAQAAGKKTQINFHYQNDRRRGDGPRRDGRDGRDGRDREGFQRRTPGGQGTQGQRPRGPRPANGGRPREGEQKEGGEGADQRTIDLADQQAFPTLEAH